jgi:hypothetical protein
MMTSLEARVSKRPHDEASLYNSNIQFSNQRLGAAAAHDDKRCCRRSSYDVEVPSTIIERPFQQLRHQESSLSFQSTTTEQSDTIREGDDTDNDDADDEMECTSSEGEDDQNDERLSMELSQQTTSQATYAESVSARMMVDDLSHQMDQTWSLTNLNAWRRRLSSLSDNANHHDSAASGHDQSSQATSRTSNYYRTMKDDSSCSIGDNSSNNNNSCRVGGGGIPLRDIIRLQQKEAKRQVMRLLRGKGGHDGIRMNDDEENRIIIK